MDIYVEASAFDSCSQKSPNFQRTHKGKADAHACWRGLLLVKVCWVWENLENVNEVIAHVFLLYKNIDNYDIHKTNYYEFILPDRQQSDSYGS